MLIIYPNEISCSSLGVQAFKMYLFIQSYLGENVHF